MVVVKFLQSSPDLDSNVDAAIKFGSELYVWIVMRGEEESLLGWLSVLLDKSRRRSKMKRRSVTSVLPPFPTIHRDRRL
jgi:hypothetical protein